MDFKDNNFIKMYKKAFQMSFLAKKLNIILYNQIK
ncbi:hypothetical protein SAMN05880573_115106 [Chryseobacterium sp. RU33C]|nr:hypothetical protein SAMN05880573_115106 [Chryseobacterium sp. RU33C]